MCQSYLGSKKDSTAVTDRLLQSLNLENDENAIEKAKELFRIHIIKRKSELRDWQQHHRSISWYEYEAPVESLISQVTSDDQNE